MKTYKLIFLGFLIMFCACKNEQTNTVKPIEINFNKEAEFVFIKGNDTLVNLDVELAESDYEHQTGLMHRDSMNLKQGMLFIYKDERPRPTFYMKNTQIPLDLIYINSDHQVVEINKNAKPYDENPIGAKQPAQYVLEVNAGFANQFNITDSLRVSFRKL